MRGTVKNNSIIKNTIYLIFLFLILLIGQNSSASEIIIYAREFPPRYSPGLGFELLLINPAGKRLGYDMKTGKIIDEIENTDVELWATYGEDSTMGPLDGPSGPYCKEMNVGRPVRRELLEGKYILNVIGIRNCIYELEIIASDRETESTVGDFSGIISKGDVHQIEIYYSPYPTVRSFFKKDVSISLLKKEITDVLGMNLNLGVKLVSNKALMISLLKQVKIIEKQIKQNKKEAARNELKLFIERLTQEQKLFAEKSTQERKQYESRDIKDVEEWFPESFIKDEGGPERLLKLLKEYPFGYERVKSEKKVAFLTGEVIRILSVEANILMESLR